MAASVIYPGDTIKETQAAKVLVKRALTRNGQKEMAAKIAVAPHFYGPAAVVGVKWLQKHYGLKADGIIGPSTWLMLRKHGSVRKKSHKINSRSSWHPAPPKAPHIKVSWTHNSIFFLHHTCTKPPTTGGAAGEQAAMRELQRIAFDRGFNDISYSYLVFPSGNIYEGRGFEIEGAHTLGHNEDIGCALVGNYETSKVTAAQEASVLWLQKKLGAERMRPHRSVFATDCPGAKAMSAFGL